MDDREVELIDYLRVLWRQKWIIAACLVSAVLAALVMSVGLPKTYSSKTSLLLLSPVAAGLRAEASGSMLPSEVCQRLAKSTDVLSSMATRMGWSQDASLAGLSSSITVSARTFSASEGTQLLLDGSFRSSSPETAAKMATAWIGAFSDIYVEMFQDRTARSYASVDRSAVLASQELEAAMGQRTELLLLHPIDTLRADSSALETRYHSDQTDLERLRRDVEADLARIQAMEEELALQEDVIVLERSLDPDTLAVLLQSGLSTRDYQALLGLRVEEEVQNGTYASLVSSIAYARAGTVEAQQRIGVLAVAVGEESRVIAAMQSEIIETQAALDSLDNDILLLKEANAKLAAKLQDAKIALAETPEPVRVIDEPFASKSPTAPSQKTSVAVAGFLGLLLGVLLAFFFDYIQRAGRVSSTSHQGGRTLGPSAGEDPDQRAESAGG